MHFLYRTLLAFALLHSVLQGQIYVLFLVFLDSYFGIPIPYNENDIFLGCFLECLVGDSIVSFFHLDIELCFLNSCSYSIA